MHAHPAAASTGCVTVGHFALEKDICNFERLFTVATWLQLDDGHVLIGDRPGIGIEIGEEALERFAL